jgi:hypothetical protein
MKKILMCLLVGTVLAAGVSAGGARDSVSVEGKIAITGSVPTIVSGGKTWILPAGPFYQIAYENNIRAGDTVKVEGFEAECPPDFAIKDAKMLMPAKVTVNGKAIDLSTVRGPGPMSGRGSDCDREGRQEGRRGTMMGGRNRPAEDDR